MRKSWENKLGNWIEILSDGKWHPIEDFKEDCSSDESTENGSTGKEIAEKAEKIGAIEINRENKKQWNIKGTELIDKIQELPKE